MPFCINLVLVTWPQVPVLLSVVERASNTVPFVNKNHWPYENKSPIFCLFVCLHHPNHLPCFKCFGLGNYANYIGTLWPRGQILSSAYCVLKVLLDPSHAHVFMYCLCFHATTAELSSEPQTVWLMNPQILMTYITTLQTGFASLC